jgi:hypothetical protein
MKNVWKIINGLNMNNMNYEIIKDLKALESFLDWLPNLKANETYYVCLFARSKYAIDKTILKADKQQLKRFTSTKGFLIDKIRQLECRIGTYKYDGKEVPIESLALYIMPNPRDMIKATKNSLKKFVDVICSNDDNVNFNPHQEVLSQIQTSSSKKRFIDFDFDNISFEDLIQQLENKINLNAVNILKTRGGYHILVEIDKIDTKNYKQWYSNIQSIASCDVTGDVLLPVVGCVQGDFVPRFVNL